MTIQQILKKYQLPNYITFWFWMNIFLIICYCMLYMTYTNGQVTVKFLDDNFFNKSFQFSDSSNYSLPLLYTDSSSSFYSLHRVYNQYLDHDHFIQIFNFYLFFLLIPLFNIVYGLSIIFDGSIIPPKDLYTLLLLKFRGVQK